MIIVLVMWARGDELVNEDVFPVVVMILNLYTNMTLISFIGYNASQYFIVVMKRISQVYQMDENPMDEGMKVGTNYPEEATVQLDKASFSWGYHVKVDQDEKANTNMQG